MLFADCRNAYESDVGAFENAVPVNTTYFSETWDKLHTMLDGVDKDAPVLTYCTGGIRCVKVMLLLSRLIDQRECTLIWLCCSYCDVFLGQCVLAAEDGVHQHSQTARRHHCIRGMGKM